LEKIFRFSHFEADRERYQLRCRTRAIKLERIPLELLFLLLEHNGKLVSREQIVAKLWRDGSFLDTERSINTAVRKLRRALGDDPRRPQFIETVVGKGYRFMAPLVPQAWLRDLHTQTQLHRKTPGNGAGTNDHEIRLRGFLVETVNGSPVLTCDVVVGRLALGRLPLSELELPSEVSLPLKPQDRLLLKLHGVRVSLTTKAAQALHAFSVAVLQSGLRERATDVFLSEAPPEREEQLAADTA
jgi:DNA-binding winged helix-turn-helix (wHTH) protein